MAEPIRPHFVALPARAGRWLRALGGPARLAVILQVALGLRIVAADAVDLYVRSGGPDQLCVFPDTTIYWGLARTIRAGTPFEYVEWSDIPHFALRTPGYPLFLAGCQAVFGERTLAVRLVQAALGAGCVYLVYRLTELMTVSSNSDSVGPSSARRRWTVPLVAAAITAVNPYYVLMSSLILSEAVFVPLMMAMLWGLALLWGEPGQPDRVVGVRADLVAVGSGAPAAAAILVRPSWALFVPAVLTIWVIAKLRDRQ